MSREESAPLLPSSGNDLPDPNPDRQGSHAVDPPKSGLASYLFGSTASDMWPTTRDKVAVVSLTVGIALFLSMTFYLVLSGDLKEMGWFAYHPPFQSLAIVAFINGITPLQPPPPSAQARSTRFAVHQRIMLGIALPALAFGSAAMIYNKYLHDAKHFTTWHSWFGLATVGWVVVQAAVGAGSVWFGGKLFGGGEKAKRVYKYHRLSGYLLVTLALLTAHLAGAYSTWALGQKGKQGVRVAAFWVGLPLIWLGIELRARPSKMKIL